MSLARTSRPHRTSDLSVATYVSQYTGPQLGGEYPAVTANELSKIKTCLGNCFCNHNLISTINANIKSTNCPEFVKLSMKLSRDWVTVDGVWIGNSIYWPLIHTARDYTLQITITVFTALLGNGFQQWTFLCSRAHVLAGWRPPHTNLLLF
jgi:hypothetical protein